MTKTLLSVYPSGADIVFDSIGSTMRQNLELTRVRAYPDILLSSPGKTLENDSWQ